MPYLQNDKNILINAGVLLINVHRIGKASNNVFTPVQKLSMIQNPSDDAYRNPVFGFKADLVRLIGNLCWKNRQMQDLVMVINNMLSFYKLNLAVSCLIF